MERMTDTGWADRDIAAPRVCTPLVVLVALSALDAALSSAMLHHGLMREVNPLMRLSLAQLGLPVTLGLKLAITAVAAGVLLGVRRELAGLLPALLWAGSLCYALLWAMALVLG